MNIKAVLMLLFVITIATNVVAGTEMIFENGCGYIYSIEITDCDWRINNGSMDIRLSIEGHPSFSGIARMDSESGAIYFVPADTLHLQEKSVYWFI